MLKFILQLLGNPLLLFWQLRNITTASLFLESIKPHNNIVPRCFLIHILLTSMKNVHIIFYLSFAGSIATIVMTLTQNVCKSIFSVQCIHTQQSFMHKVLYKVRVCECRCWSMRGSACLLIPKAS